MPNPMADMAPIPCSKCGIDHLRCTAHARSTGKACQSPRMRGLTVCRSHGGLRKAAKEAGLRRYAQQKAIADAEALIAHSGVDPVTDPLTALAALAGEAVAMKDALAARVNALTAIRYEDNKGAEQLRSEIVLYERALDRAGRFVDVLARSGFEEARVKMEHQNGMLFALALRRILDALELTEAQRTLVGTVVPNELRRIGAEPQGAPVRMGP